MPRPLRTLPTVRVTGSDDIDAVTEQARRVVVLGSSADLSTVLTRLLRTERLDVEVAHVTRRRGARQALTGSAQRVPLIRDETGTVLVSEARWLPADGAEAIEGEAIVDDTVLFDGHAPALRVQPINVMPGLRAAVLPPGPLRRPQWVTGRAAQLGTPAATVIRDGVPMPRPVRRSTFYRHTQGWLRVGRTRE
ncbi:hypothetical protein A5727_01555 [Mycobacterium sp. ACS4331]|nr:hypothetical protein A5727_01555 [Mycobacterium sp. ACS4331]